MKTNFKIYQINDEKLSYKHSIKMYSSKDLNIEDLNIDLNDYNYIYEGVIESIENNINAILEKIFTKFNINIPENFTGRSLSIGDIIEIDKNYYVIDIIGFKKIH